MDFFGKPAIHPLLFYSGKIAGYVVWTIYILAVSVAYKLEWQKNYYLILISYSFAVIASVIFFFSLLHLGRSTRFGLSSDNTAFKTKGLYRFSRNPMYLGFNLFTFACMLYMPILIFVILGLYSIIIFHFIILKEEKYLIMRFGGNYNVYKKKTRRYF
ncbi:MAG: isoprenylcysteine carboxylmethyltransferase family protein [Bacteroidales bacterium]|nr:isoprenylcysteine carboxylmethyltransferase family protein [Bacteroidales bacterium]